jgi:hypothetical protein
VAFPLHGAGPSTTMADPGVTINDLAVGVEDRHPTLDDFMTSFEGMNVRHPGPPLDVAPAGERQVVGQDQGCVFVAG